ncbi:MAG: hypothetical protein ACRDTD_22415 [Pseudonocardiaceae bacterium]
MINNRVPTFLGEGPTLHDQLAGSCPQMTALAGQLRTFAGLLVPAADNPEALTSWLTRTRDADLPFLHSFANGLERAAQPPMPQ